MFHGHHKTVFCIASVVLLLCTLHQNSNKLQICEGGIAAQGTITSGSKYPELMAKSQVLETVAVSLNDRARVT